VTPRRVLIVTPDYPPAHGGIQVLVHRIASGMSRLTPRVVTLDADRAASFDADWPVQVHRVSTQLSARAIKIMALNRQSLLQAARSRPDVVLSAHIVTSPAAVAIQRLLKVPFVQYFHAKEIGAKPGLASFAAKNANASIAVSRYTRGLAIDAGGDPARIHRIPVGVDLPERDRPVRRKTALSGGRPTVLTIARLEDRYKGHDVLVRAMPLVRARLPDLLWVVIGDGPLRNALEHLAAVQGLSESVRFLGAVSDEERNAWLGEADVFTMPSRLPAGGYAGEGFGIVYLEANAHQMPVVAGNVAGALDAVHDGDTGVLVDPTDHVALADALSDLLLDPERAARMGRSGAERSRQLAWPEIARRVEDLLLGVARGKPPVAHVAA
jgi:phosphatidyl-myo-inositol dimannoside synthase